MVLDGSCHCGALTVSFETARAPAELPLRACGCSFCRRHGAIAVTDPAGRVEVRIRDAGRLSRYQFGLRSSDFLLCRACGVYVAAVCAVDGRTYATLNANVLDARSAFTAVPTPVDYQGETREQRLARRARSWTPAEVIGA
jgi:hypothetical protein